MSEALPRYRRRSFCEAVGLLPIEIEPASDDHIRKAGVARLASATAAALAVDPAISGNTPPVVEARRAVAHLARALGFDSGDLVRALGVSARSARRLDERPVATECSTRCECGWPLKRPWLELCDAGLDPAARLDAVVHTEAPLPIYLADTPSTMTPSARSLTARER